MRATILTSFGIALLALAALMSGCAVRVDTTAIRLAALQSRTRELEEQNRALTQRLATETSTFSTSEGGAEPPMGSSVRAPITYRMKPLMAWRDHQPMFCGGALCLRFENATHGTMTNIRIGGAPVFIEGLGGFLIPPRGHLFIRFPVPGRYELTADVVDEIRTPHGSIPTRTVLEQCRKEFFVGTRALPSDQFKMGGVDWTSCDSALPEKRRRR